MDESIIRLLAQIGIPISAIENSFSAATLKRGIKYFEGHRAEITSIESFSGNDIKIHADVFGSKGYPYSIIVTLVFTKSYISIIGECDCPVGFRCKHAVATILEFAKNNAQSIIETGTLNSIKNLQTNANEVEDWLNNLNIEGAKAQVTANQSNALLYLLKPTDDEHGIEVVSIIARRLKKGGFGKAKAQSLEELIDGYHLHINYDYSDLDVEIAGLLHSIIGQIIFYKNNIYPLKGDIGELALSKLLKSQRCYWMTHENNKPLQPGIERELNISWQQQGKQYSVVAEVIPDAQELFQLQSIYYIDKQNLEVGTVINSELSPFQLQQILKAPLVPENMVEQVSQKILKTWPETNIPVPMDLAIETIRVESPPFARLTISTIDNEYLSSLQFDYDGYIIQPDPHSSVYGQLKNKQRIQIVRNVQFEQQCIEELEKYFYKYEVSDNKLSYVFNIQADTEQEVLWRWHDFLNDTIPQLQAHGWQIEIDQNFNLRFDEAQQWYGKLESDDSSDWFEISLGIEIDGHSVNLLPSLVELLVMENDVLHLKDYLSSREEILIPIMLDDNLDHWLKLPAKRIQTIFNTLIELYDSQPLNDQGNLLVNKYKGVQFHQLLNDPTLKWHGAKELQMLCQKLKSFSGLKEIKSPNNLLVTLRDYQHYGLSWLQFLRDYRFNGILADDMGLGKTVQVIAHLLLEKQLVSKLRVSLVIAPTSLLSNWKREIQRFAPDLNVLVLHGLKRQKLFAEISAYDIVLTSYPLVLKDQLIHQEQHYHFIILDEAQMIKNARSKTAQAVFQLSSDHRLCMTGTPMENHLGELWSLFHFLMPGFLGTQTEFNRLFRLPIEKQGSSDRHKQLVERIKPFMLRRTKAMVATELPPKTEIMRTVALTGKQRDLYETVRMSMDNKVRDEIDKRGITRSQIMILDALLKLRQTCCDPRLLSLSQAKTLHVSAKLNLLMTLLPEMIEEGRKIIIFSQFVKMLALIEEELEKHHIQYCKLTGQTKKRDEAICEFQETNTPVFLISLKAGGVGLNLTAADTVIHYDPWWNPAVEQQATDRAYRIGQDKPVFVYKLLTENTVEEKIIYLQNTKQQLISNLYDDNQKENEELVSKPDMLNSITKEQLMQLLSPIDSE